MTINRNKQMPDVMFDDQKHELLNSIHISLFTYSQSSSSMYIKLIFCHNLLFPA